MISSLKNVSDVSFLLSCTSVTGSCSALGSLSTCTCADDSPVSVLSLPCFPASPVPSFPLSSFALSGCCSSTLSSSTFSCSVSSKPSLEDALPKSLLLLGPSATPLPQLSPSTASFSGATSSGKLSTLTRVPSGLVTAGLQQKRDRYTGRMHKPWRRPNKTIPRNIRKNIRKISDAANARTIIPRKVLKPTGEKVFLRNTIVVFL